MKKLMLCLGMYFLLSTVYAQHKIGEKYKDGIVFSVDNTGMHGLIADTKDLVGQMEWDDAVKTCKEKGEGWYLPNKYELNLLYNQKNVVGGFNEISGYWSSSETDIFGYVWWQEFDKGSQFKGIPIIPASVRAIRAF